MSALHATPAEQTTLTLDVSYGRAVRRPQVERLHERPAERVADDRQDRAVRLLDRRERDVRVEASVARA